MTLNNNLFENIKGKGENAGNQHFLLFPTRFSTHSKTNSNFQSHIFCCLQMLSIWSSLIICCLVRVKPGIVWSRNNPFPHNDIFWRPWETSLLKTCLDNFLPFSSNSKLSSANSFSFEESTICRLVMGYKMKGYADDNFKFDENTESFLNRYKSTVGKGEIARYKQFLLFLRCF